MIPQGGTIAATQIVRQPSRTYRLDLSSKRIIGITDGLEAVKQAVYKILQTERFASRIYNGSYGSVLKQMIGSDASNFMTVVMKNIRESLRQDDRITDVQDFIVDNFSDVPTVGFTVISTYGAFQMTQEV